MLFNDLDSFLEDVIAFKKTNFNSYFKVVPKPVTRQIGLMAYLEDDSTKEWILPISKLRSSKILNAEERDIIYQFFSYGDDFTKFKVDFINLLDQHKDIA